MTAELVVHVCKYIWAAVDVISPDNIYSGSYMSQQ